MPDYDKTLVDHVKLFIPGNVINENYSLLLMERADLDLATLFFWIRYRRNNPSQIKR